jgi:hypothetical protein
LAAVPAFGNEVGGVISFLVGLQQADGSWEGDPHSTALALRAIRALATVPYCGDGAIDQPGEACDGGVPAGVSCEALALGPGTIACSPQCTFDTSGCSAAPICGDNVRNQPFEVCDGTDLAAQTCGTQGFATGALACGTDCLSFDVSGCNAAPACGDGIVNQPGEACDLEDFNGTTCESLGLGGGQLGCTSDCNFDTGQCDSSTFVIDNKGREFIVAVIARIGHRVGAAHERRTHDRHHPVPVNSPSFSTTVR